MFEIIQPSSESKLMFITYNFVPLRASSLFLSSVRVSLAFSLFKIENCSPGSIDANRSETKKLIETEANETKRNKIYKIKFISYDSFRFCHE